MVAVAGLCCSVATGLQYNCSTAVAGFNVYCSPSHWLTLLQWTMTQ